MVGLLGSVRRVRMQCDRRAARLCVVSIFEAYQTPLAEASNARFLPDMRFPRVNVASHNYLAKPSPLRSGPCVSLPYVLKIHVHPPLLLSPST